MKVLIDTNILLDIILKRSGYDMAMKIFYKAREDQDEAYITASAVTDIFYIIRKETHSIEATYHAMRYVFQLVSILSVTEADIRDAMEKKWKDFEDCVQYITAFHNQIDYIITNNSKDFEETLIPIFSPKEYMAS